MDHNWNSNIFFFVRTIFSSWNKNVKKSIYVVPDRVWTLLNILLFSYSMIPLVGDSILEREDAEDDDDVE